MSEYNYEIQEQEVLRIVKKLVENLKGQASEPALVDATTLELMVLLRIEHKAGIKAGLDYYLEEEATIDEMWQRKIKLANELS